MPELHEAASEIQTVLDLAEARLRNPQTLTPFVEHDLKEIIAAARRAVSLLEKVK